MIAIKESFAVERLTRITLLLAKVTMLFMPVSLMSGYFSSQFTDSAFKVRNYWTWFGIILSITILFLMSFGLLSGTSIRGIAIIRKGRAALYGAFGRPSEPKN